jgi:hypothetical protein
MCAMLLLYVSQNHYFNKSYTIRYGPPPHVTWSWSGETVAPTSQIRKTTMLVLPAMGIKKYDVVVFLVV